MSRPSRRALLRPEIVPESGDFARIGELFPKDGRHLAVSLVLGAVFVAWLAAWAYGNRGLLFDPMLQSDDVRTSLFPFHRYGPEKALLGDPIAEEMLASVPPAVHLLYRALTPTTGLFAASKVVQGLCLGGLLLSGLVLLRSRRVGLAGGVLLVFLVLHTPLVVQRGIAGGLPRAFAFPALALWAAGALAASERVRFAACLISAFTYPSSLLILLAAEGLFSLRDGFDLRGPKLRWRLARYALLSAVCLGLVAFYLSAKSDAGSARRLEEAKQDPAFRRDGRIEALPFPNPAVEFPRYFLAPFLEAGRNLLPGALGLHPEGRGRFLIAMPFVLTFAVLVWRRKCPPPWAFLSLAAGTAIVYAASRAMAFRLYWPERYYAYGMPMAGILLATETLGLAWPGSGETSRAARRNGAALAVVLLLLVAAGDGIDPHGNGMTLDGRRNSDLYAFARSLPPSVRFASHPLDGDDLPYWAARATVGGYETLQPWFENAWRREKARAEDVLRALYATRRETVLEYCRRNAVTHLLLRRGDGEESWIRSRWIRARDRYGPDFREQALLFEPLGTFVAELLRDLSLRDLVLADPPGEAVVFRSREFLVLEVGRLERSWGELRIEELRGTTGGGAGGP